MMQFIRTLSLIVGIGISLWGVWMIGYAFWEHNTFHASAEDKPTIFEFIFSNLLLLGFEFLKIMAGLTLIAAAIVLRLRAPTP